MSTDASRPTTIARHERTDVEPAGRARAASNPHRSQAERFDHDRFDHDRFDTTWPVKGAEVVRLVVAALVVVGTGTLAGSILTDWAAPNSITRLDERIADWFVDSRTDALNSFSDVAAFPADTIPKVVISTIICVVFLWRWRRWDEAVYIALPLVFEVLCFIAITRTVQRPRPDAEQLIHSSIDTSFPSGHVAASTVYVAVVVVVFRRTAAAWVRGLAVGLFVVVAVGVYWSRLYQGVHFASDVLAGIILGAVSVVITDRVLGRRHDDLHHDLHHDLAAARRTPPTRNAGNSGGCSSGSNPRLALARCRASAPSLLSQLPRARTGRSGVGLVRFRSLG